MTKRWNGKPAVIDYQGPAALSPSERRWMADRLNEAGIETPAMDREDFDIPIVIHDREILDLIRDGDRRADRIAAGQIGPLIADAPLTEAVPIAQHAQRPSWMKANRAEVWLWIGIGVGGLAAAELVGVLALSALLVR